MIARAPGPAAESAGTTRVVLRDGSAAALRLTTAADRPLMRAFFERLSPQSRRRRFLGVTRVTESLIASLCDSTDLQRAATLVICRHTEEAVRFIGVGSYFASSLDRSSAEVAFAVDDAFHGHGVGTALLEHLVPMAIDHGFTGFEATVLAENFEMLDVFRDSGFEVRSTTERGCVEVRLALAPSPTSASAADERDRFATVTSLRPLLEPHAVAVIGVSRRESNLGRRIFEALRTSRGSAAARLPVYPVNPAADAIDGATCYPTVSAAPRGVDLAVIAVPRDAVLSAVDDCAAAGVKAVAVITAGFAETGEEGRALQERLVETVRGYGMRMVGPNCMGVFNTREPFRFNASFAEQLPSQGTIALASQSGGLGLAILQLAENRGIGLSTFVSLGNKGDVSGNDLLQYGETDPHTSVILLYLESLGNPRRFARLARRISQRKPIIAVKAGRTPSGSRAAASHTAGLAASELAVDALFHQSGVIRADTIDEMFDIAVCLTAQPLPAGRRVAVLTNAGGPGILAADACMSAGLQVNELSAATRAQLSACLSQSAAAANPVDMVATAGPSEYRQTIEILLASAEVDALMVIYTTIERHRSEDILSAIQDAVRAGRLRGHRAPVLLCTVASAHPAQLREAGETLPVYAFPEQAAKALGKAADYAAWCAAPQGRFPSYDGIDVRAARAFCQQIVAQRGDAWLEIEELRRLLEAFQVEIIPGSVTRTAEEALLAAQTLGFPVVLKIVSTRGIHKSDSGGVRLDLSTNEAVVAAFAELTTRSDTTGVLVQPMLAGIETFIGLTQDPLFGPLVAFGLGGTTVEVFRDVVFRIAPLADRDADEMLQGIRGVRLLQGFRGRPAADLEALRDLLLRVSYLGAQIPELLELDFNPVMAFAPGRGCSVVDARARVGPHH